MKTRNSVKIATCLCLAGFVSLMIVSSTVSAQSREVFRWVDEDGVVHFSQKPPQAKEYDKYRPNIGKVGTVAPSDPVAAIDVSADQQAAQAEQKDSPGAEPELSAEELAMACQRAEENVALLEPVTNVLVPDGSGGRRRLDDEERLDWLEKSRAFFNENCR